MQIILCHGLATMCGLRLIHATPAKPRPPGQVWNLRPVPTKGLGVGGKGDRSSYKFVVSVPGFSASLNTTVFVCAPLVVKHFAARSR